MGNRLIRRDRKTVAEERVRAMMVRRDQLRREGRAGRMRVPIEEPYLWGYRRFFVLRPDLAGRKDAYRLQALLEVVQKEDDCKRKDFLVWDGRARRWEEWEHKPRKLYPREYNRLSPDLKCYFERSWTYWKGVRYEVAHPWMFQTRRSKLYITHRLLPNVEVEQELSYLNDRIYQNDLEGIATKVKSPRNRWKRRRRPPRRRTILAQIHRREIGEALLVHAQAMLGCERGKEVNEDAKA